MRHVRSARCRDSSSRIDRRYRRSTTTVAGRPGPPGARSARACRGVQGRPGAGLQAGRAQQARFMLGHALAAEMPAARGTPADRFPQLMIPAALMNEDARHAVYPVSPGHSGHDLKDSTNPAMASSAAPPLYIGRIVSDARERGGRRVRAAPARRRLNRVANRLGIRNAADKEQSRQSPVVAWRSTECRDVSARRSRWRWRSALRSRPRIRAASHETRRAHLASRWRRHRRGGWPERHRNPGSAAPRLRRPAGRGMAGGPGARPRRTQSAASAQSSVNTPWTCAIRCSSSASALRAVQVR